MDGGFGNQGFALGIEGDGGEVGAEVDEIRKNGGGEFFQTGRKLVGAYNEESIYKWRKKVVVNKDLGARFVGGDLGEGFKGGFAGGFGARAEEFNERGSDSFSDHELDVID